MMHKNYRKFSLKFTGIDPCPDKFEDSKVDEIGCQNGLEQANPE